MGSCDRLTLSFKESYNVSIKRYCLHEAESFLRSRQSISYSRISLHFKESEDSSPWPQEPSLLVPVLSHMNPVHTTPSYFSNIHLNIELGSLSRYSDGQRNGRPGFDSQQCKIFLFSTAYRMALGLTQPPIQMATGGSFFGDETTGM
jgi:hypothetical protein